MVDQISGGTKSSFANLQHPPANELNLYLVLQMMKASSIILSVLFGFAVSKHQA